MTDGAPVDTQRDLIQLLQGASLVMGGLCDLVAEIEGEALGALATGPIDGSTESAMQKIDLLLQSLGEMQRLLDSAPGKLGVANGYCELVADIQLEQVRVKFDREHANGQFKLAKPVEPAITFFE